MDNIIKKITKLILEKKESKDVDPKLKDWIEKRYGPWNERDFISDKGDTYFKTDEVNKETGSVSHTIIKLPSFTELVKQLKRTKDAANNLVKGESVRDDEVLRSIADELRLEFNKFRTHLRKEYPAFYAQLKGQLTESTDGTITESKGAKNYFDDLIFNYQKTFRYLESDEKKEYQRLAKNYFSKVEEMSTTGGGAGSATFTPGTGMQYATPFAFKLKKKKKEVKENVGSDLGPGPKAGPKGVSDNAYVKDFGYKLVPSKIKDSGIIVKQLFEAGESTNDFQQKRMAAFDRIEQEINDIYKMLSNAKNETAEYYKENPGSYGVVKPTDLVLDYVKDIKDLLKGE
jgi:hypothetical protein